MRNPNCVWRLAKRKPVKSVGHHRWRDIVCDASGDDLQTSSPCCKQQIHQ